MTLFTHLVPYPNAKEFPRSLGVARPTDADSLRAWLAWMSLAVWPTPPEHPPWEVRAALVKGWPLRRNHTVWLLGPEGGTITLWPPGSERFPEDNPATPEEWLRREAAYLMTVAATAHGASRVVPPQGEEIDAEYETSGPMSLSLNGVPVRLDSWQQLRDGDTAALWVWSLADRTEVHSDRDHQARRTKQRGEDQLEPALNTAQAIHDALALLLPQLTDDPSTPPQKRNASWR